MGDIALEYLIPNGASIDAIKGQIRDRVHYAEDSVRELTSRFLDSFDWSLYLAGASVEERLDAGSHQLLWHDLGADTVPAQQGIEREPGFVWDLPQGPVRERLEPVLGVRRLLPLLQVRARTQTLRLLNEDDKTVVRLLLKENRFSDPNRDREGPLAVRVRLLPVRGYEANLHQVARILSQDLGLEPARTGVLPEALVAAGLRPGDYSSRLDFNLDPGQRADATTKEILLQLLDTLEANVAGTKANLDSEFLHDLRVATRRTRSALSQIKGVFAPDLVADYKARFSWVQQVTGPVRDLDVYLLDFGGYRASLPEPLRPHLEPLKEFLTDHYDATQKQMVRALESSRFRTLLTSWRAFIEAPVPEHSALSNARRSTKEVADERIWKMYRRVCKEGRAIGSDSPAEELHELRKSCKKLRYLLEFFSSLYPKKQVQPLVKILKRLLDDLGRFQDFAVQAHHLQGTARQLWEEGRGDTDSLLAIGVLVGDLYRRQQQARSEFADLFSRFDAARKRAAFRDLFAPATKRGQRS